MRVFLPCFIAAALLASCTPQRAVRLGLPSPLASPAGPGASCPRLATSPDGAVLMTWFEPRPEGGHVLRFARLNGDAWTAPVAVAAGDSFFVNWADVPALVALDTRRIAVSYPWRSGGDTYAYDVRIQFSADGGATWGPPIVPHTDGTATEHGFVTLLAEDGALRAVWLDGRNFAGAVGHDDHDGGPGPDMTLRTAQIAEDGALRDEALLDARTCDCCGTAGAVTGGETWVVYRDRADGEIRDVSLVRRAGAAWSEPAPVHADGWEIPGCPVNGPALAADGDGAAIAWFTQAGDTARVYAAFAPAGTPFGAPVRIDGGDPLGRVDVALLGDGSAAVSWLEALPDTAEVRLARVGGAGPAAGPVTLARTSPRRASGFPRIVRAGTRLICAWTEPGAPSAVRVSAVPLAD